MGFLSHCRIHPSVVVRPDAGVRTSLSGHYWLLSCETFANLVNIIRQVNQKGKLLPEIAILPAQCRGARGMLGWTQEDLARAAGVSRPTVKDFERGVRTPHTNNLLAIRAALETAGVEFIEENGGGAGVRLRKDQG